MSSFKDSLKKAFGAVTEKYSFENGPRKAEITTRKGLLTSSYKIAATDSSIGLNSEQTGFSLLRNCTGEGVKKAKAFCGLK